MSTVFALVCMNAVCYVHELCRGPVLFDLRIYTCAMCTALHLILFEPASPCSALPTSLRQCAPQLCVQQQLLRITQSSSGCASGAGRQIGGSGLSDKWYQKRHHARPVSSKHKHNCWVVIGIFEKERRFYPDHGLDTLEIKQTRTYS